LADGGCNTPGCGKTDKSNRSKRCSSEEGALRPQFIPKCSSENARNKQRQSAEG
jgi:hypothetical protein